MVRRSRTPQGVRGLKLDGVVGRDEGRPSHSARSAWIETRDASGASPTVWSHSARSAWIETLRGGSIYWYLRSHSARSAWIETQN